MTDEQFDLFGSSGSGAYFYPTLPSGGKRANGYEMFLALRPQPVDIVRMLPDIRQRQQVADSRILKAIAPDLWHITLSAIAHFDERFPQAKLDAIEVACKAVSLATRIIPVAHDRLMGFQPSGAGALLCTAETAEAIRRLRGALATALKNVGVGSKASSTPHLTIFYDKHQPAAEVALDMPLTWDAVDFSLVVSHQGLGHHEVVHTWSLQK